MIKAIPTEYNGTLYRSKLEAKWATYFDLCGVRFEYEPYAFDLGDGVKYLHDFLVKDVLSVHGKCGSQTLENSDKYYEFWFEVKGVMSDYDSIKIEKFCKEIYVNEDVDQYLPFYVLDRSPKRMFLDFDSFEEPFNFEGIDYDYFPFVIGKPLGTKGLGLFGADSNYLCLMDNESRQYAEDVEKIFRWNK